LAPLVGADVAAAAAHRRDVQEATHAAELQARLTVPVAEPFAGLSAFVGAAYAFAHSRPGDAAIGAEQAAAAFGRSGWRLWQGRALTLAGRSLAAQALADRAESRVVPVVGPTPGTQVPHLGDDARAVELLDQASDLFDAIGANTRRQESDVARSALSRRGRKSKRQAETAIPLTAREHEVARLAADGLSARDIAGQLFIGKRTVETHLANVYIKLDVKSRLELARRLSALDT
jgi:DNA-binding CsgD family transcriptional regulator